MTIRPFTGIALSASVKPLPSLVAHATPMSVQRALSPSPVTLNKRGSGGLSLCQTFQFSLVSTEGQFPRLHGETRDLTLEARIKG